MATRTDQRASLTIDIEHELGQRVQTAASMRQLSVTDYVELTLRAALATEDYAGTPPASRVSDEDRERGLRALDNLARLDRELMAQRDGRPFPPSWELINEMREERTRELMPDS